MQLGFGTVTGAMLCLPLLAAILTAQSGAVRGYGRLISHELEVVEGCSGLTSPASRKVTLSPGQPLPIPLPIACGATTLRVNRFRLSVPPRTEPGLFTGQQIAFDVPMQVSYDLSADWSGGLPVTIEANVAAVAGVEVSPCNDTLSANLNSQASRVCQWTSVGASLADGFSLNSRFSYAPASGSGPIWSVKSTARYAWTAAPAIERIEIVQAVQTEDQRVPLFAGKPTHVRIFPIGAAPESTRVQLEVKYPGGVWRTTPARTVVVPAQLNRASDARSFLIPLPPEVVAAPGPLVIDAQLLTGESRLLAALTKPFTADIVEAPRAALLGYMQVCESSADGRDRVCPNAAASSPQILGAVAEQLMPVTSLPQTMLGSVVVPAGPGVDTLRRLARLRQWFADVPTNPAAIVAAVLPAQSEWAARLAGRWSPSLRLAFASDDPRGPLQLARAVSAAHGVVPLAATAVTGGFDLRSGSVIAAGDPAWFGASTVEALAASLRPRVGIFPGASEFLTISGSIARDKSTGSIGFGFRSAIPMAVFPFDVAAPACLRLSAGSGEVNTFCFAVEPLDESASEDAFSVRLPWLAGTQRITLLYDGVELATRNLSASPPQAELLTPQAGNRIPEGPLTVQWSGSDADGDALRYDLLISTDGGTTWTPIVCELDRTDFTLDTSMFPTSSRVLLQLRFSDGLQSGAVTTGPFEFIGAGGQIQAPTLVALPPMLAGQPTEANIPIANSGSGTLFLDSLTIASPSVQLIGPSFPAQIAPGSSMPLRLRIIPPSLGALSSAIAIDGPLTAARIQVTGRGVNARGPQIETAPASLDFGPLTTGESRELTLTIGNGGGAPLTITAPKLSQAFRISGFDAPLTLAPAGQQQLTVRFQPVSAGSAFEAFTLESDDPLRRTLTVAFSGHAVDTVVAKNPKIDVRPAPSADFGNVRVGVPSQQTFTVRNSGVAPLVIQRLSVTPADYSVRDFPRLPLTLAPGTEQLFFVRLDATATGARLGSLQFDSNDPVTPVLRIGLSAVASLPISGTVVLQLDDGVFERYAGFTSGDGFFLNRLKPSAYPATLKAIRIYFGERSLEPGENFGLLWAAHPTGAEDLPANLRMQSTSATVRNPVEFVEYPVTTPITIESGDFLVGFQTNKPTAAPLDTSAGQTRRTYVSRDGASWRPSELSQGFPSGVFAVRAVVDVGVKP